MNEQIIEQRGEEMSFDATCLTYEASDEVLGAASGANGLLGPGVTYPGNQTNHQLANCC